MRFTHAWADLANQNLALKVSVTALSIATIILSITSTKLALKEPLIIEKSCYSKMVSRATSTEHTPEEIEVFLSLALSMRFDTGRLIHPGYLSQDEDQARLQEQRELLSRNMTQRILLGAIKISGNKVEVQADRIISVGTLKSALNFPLIAELSTTDRTEGNPYGLIISKVSQNTPKKEDSK